MDVDKVRRLVGELAKLMKKTGIGEITVEKGDIRISLRREDGQVVSNVEEREQEAPAAQESTAGLKKISAPMVGTFFKSPSPGASPFVEIGDEVEEGQTVCILEAMKLMNEITAEEKGIVKEVLVEDGHPVEFGQALFLYLPVGRHGLPAGRHGEPKS